MFLNVCLFAKKTSGTLLIRIFLLLALALTTSLVHAQDEAADETASEEAAEAEGDEGEAGAEGAPATGQAIYLPIKPQFVVNYGGAGRLRYLKAEVSVRLATTNAAHAVREHLPYVRHNLVMLFASQTNETVSSQEGKEQILIDARESIRDILERENGIAREEVVDVYFNTFFVQK